MKERHSFRHGHNRKTSVSPTYYSWKMMKQRCLNPNSKDFRHYGARGITICERWLLFENFLADMQERPPGMTLERIDTNGPYEKFSRLN